MWAALKGRKTYLIAFGTGLYAVLGLALGHHDANVTMELIIEAAMVSGLRHGVG
jgi:L-rhamnose isomerase